jgi:putative transposase
MTRKQDSAKRTDWKELMAGQEDFLRSLIQEVVRQVLEAEMEDAVGAEKGERTPNRQGYRAGYYGRTLVTRVGKNCACSRTDRADSGLKCSSVTSAVRKHWLGP